MVLFKKLVEHQSVNLAANHSSKVLHFTSLEFTSLSLHFHFTHFTFTSSPSHVHAASCVCTLRSYPLCAVFHCGQSHREEITCRRQRGRFSSRRRYYPRKRRSRGAGPSLIQSFCQLISEYLIIVHDHSFPDKELDSSLHQAAHPSGGTQWCESPGGDDVDGVDGDGGWC